MNLVSSLITKMHRQLGRAYTTLVSTATSRSALDLIITSATSSSDTPIPENVIWGLVIALSSPSLSHSFALSFTRRLGRTKSRTVALKCLLLLHHLLQTLPLNHPFHSDILSARQNSLLSLRPLHLRKMHGNHLSFFHSYSRLLEGVVNHYRLLTSKPLQQAQHLQGLIDNAMDCVPRGAAARSPVARSVMRLVVRESVISYLAMRRNLSMVLDGILQMSYRSCVEGLAVYKKASEQAARLGEFYQWCGEMGYCAPYEYPFVEKIPTIQVVMLEAFVEQTWRLTEDEDEASSETTVEEGGRDKQVVVSFEWEKFEEEEEEEGEEEEVKPLIEVEDDDRSWEVELEDSVKLIWNREADEKMRDEKSLQLFSPDLFNPFFG